jgi:ankyrin repeat protein
VLDRLLKILINYFRLFLYGLVFYGFSLASAGSYEDFFKAIKQDDAKAMQSLLQRGFDPNTLDPEARHGLTMAVAEPSLKVAEVLIQAKGINVNFLNSADESALMYAALKGHLAVAKLLISKDADVNKTGWTPLHYAATNGHVDVIQLLLDNHAFVDAASPNGSTPLMLAAQYGTPQAVKLLLDEGAEPLQKNEQGLTAIDFARRASRIDSERLIAEAIRRQQPKGTW